MMSDAEFKQAILDAVEAGHRLPQWEVTIAEKHSYHLTAGGGDANFIYRYIIAAPNEERAMEEAEYMLPSPGKLVEIERIEERTGVVPWPKV